jgi:hypothetical protein
VTYRKIVAQPSPNVERRPGLVLAKNGRGVSVRFRDGTTYSMPLAPFEAQGIETGQNFVLVLTYAGRTLQGVRVEPTIARPAAEHRTTPKIQVRDLRGRLTTRKA